MKPRTWAPSLTRFLTALALLMSSCSPVVPGDLNVTGGTSGGNPSSPQVSLKFGSYSPSISFMDRLIPPAQASVNSLVLCIKRLRFDPVESSQGTQNFELNLGAISLSSAGTQITSLNVPLGAYRRVRIDISQDCASGKSFQLVNDQGSFSTSDGATIEFQGNLLISTPGQVVKLGIQGLISRMNSITASDQLKNQAEAASGPFEP